MKADWNSYLHKLRKREIELIFRRCSDSIFEKGLEVGAGDGFQSLLLIKYVKHLICTEYDAAKLQRSSSKKLHYKICDAEFIDTYFQEKTFDIIFSSNLLEHLQKRERALKAMKHILKDEGVMIHTMPSAFWKICQIMLFYPNKIIEIIETVNTPEGRKRLLNRLCGRASSEICEQQLIWDNNPKTAGRNRKRHHIWPQPHGVYENNFMELLSFKKTAWISLIERSGFCVINVVRLPVSSGYGFGLDCLRDWLEKLGFSSTYAYVCIKEDKFSAYSKYWVDQR